MAQTISMAPRFENAAAYPGTHWEWVLTLSPDQEAENYSQLDERTDYTFEAITVSAGMIKHIVGAGSQYMSAAKDSSGDWLDGGKTYHLRVPADVPVTDFWSVTVYDNQTRSMIRTDTNKAALSSYDDLKKMTTARRSLFRTRCAEGLRGKLHQDHTQQGLVHLFPLVRADRGVLQQVLDPAGHRKIKSAAAWLKAS